MLIIYVLFVVMNNEKRLTLRCCCPSSWSLCCKCETLTSCLSDFILLSLFQCQWFCFLLLFSVSSACLSFLFFIRSQQSVARWEMSLSTFLLIAPSPFFLTFKHTNLPNKAVPFPLIHLSQYWTTNLKRQYWELRLIAFRRLV